MSASRRKRGSEWRSQSPSCPRLSRASTSSLLDWKEDVGGQDKPGHDGYGRGLAVTKPSRLVDGRGAPSGRTTSMHRISRRHVVGSALAAPLVMLSRRGGLVAGSVRVAETGSEPFGFNTARIGAHARVLTQGEVGLAVFAVRVDAPRRQAAN